MRRLIAIVLVALALSPGLFWRDSPVLGPQPLLIAPLPLPAGATVGPGLTIAGGWRLDSDSEDFGGYSALLSLPGGSLLALSDRGRMLRFDPRDLSVPAVMGAVGAADGSDKRQFDIEAATRDPVRDTLWIAYEGRNAIVRLDRKGRASAERRPAQMRHWPTNSGPEAIVRLTDGRFIVVSEALAGGRRPAAEGLLFAGDPVAGAEAAGFRLVPPAGFRATDMAQLPDGRVLILLRKIEFGLPPRLTSRLVVADPATLEPGQEWAWRPFAEIGAGLPAENYEGLAIEPLPNGAVRLWLIADDNNSALQRTLLLAFDWWPPETRASGEAQAAVERTPR